jgi:hypothetical protein
MDGLRPIELTRMDELNILQNVRLIHRHDLNPIVSKENLRVQFTIEGEVRGSITCYLCLDNKELSAIDKNFLFPLFVESMNILIGRQISVDEELNSFKIKFSPPKLSMIPTKISTIERSMTQRYELEIDDLSYIVLSEYSLETLN